MSITSGVRTITPKQAMEWLDKTTMQRPVNQRAVDALAAQIKAETFVVNGEGVIIGNNGAVLDGQHRLWACIEANTPFRSLVVEGIDPATFATIDTGKARTGGDIVALVTGNKNMPTAVRQAAAAAIKICLSVDRDGRINLNKHKALTNTEVADFMGRHPVFVAITEKVRSLFNRNHGFTVSHFVALVFLVSRGFPDVLESFVEPCVSGANLVRDSAAYAMREKCLADPKPADFRVYFDRLAVLFKAWNAHVMGTPVKLLRISRGVEAFPSLIMSPGQKVVNRKKA